MCKLTSESDIVVVVQLVDGLDLSSDVKLLDVFGEVADGGVLRVSTENLNALIDPDT